MDRIVYLAHDRDEVMQDGVIYGSRAYDHTRKGLSGRWPLIYAQVLDSHNDGPCCPQHGEEIELTAGDFGRVAAKWHICVPEVGAERRRKGHVTHTLYLIPDNHPELEDLAYRGPADDIVVGMGMSYTHCTVDNAQQLVDEVVDYLATTSIGDHLHLVILADRLPLRPPAGQPGSCSCGQIASPACDNRQCASCCRGCSRHAAASADSSSSICREDRPYSSPQPQQQQQHQVHCGCGQPAAAACQGLQCATCCHDYSCRRHWDFSDSSSSSSSEASSLDSGQQYCSCRQPAAAACRSLKCARCCCDPSCRRHWPAIAAPVTAAPALQQLQHTQQEYNRVVAQRQQAQGLTLSDESNMATTATCAGQYASSNSSRSTVPAAQSSNGSRKQRCEQLLHQLTEFLCNNPQQQEVVWPMMELFDLVCDMSTAANIAQQEDEQHRGASTAAGASSGSRQLHSPGVAAAVDGVCGGSSSYDGFTAAEQLHQLQSCIVCLDAPRSVVLMPCRHLVLCAACSRQLQHHAARDDPPGTLRRSCALCPVCREPAKQHMGGIIMA